MRTRSVPRLLLPLAAALLALAGACPARAATIFGLTSADQLVRFDHATPGSPSSPLAIAGLAPGESLLGIDFRPATGQLYGVGSTGRLYVVNPNTGAATGLGSMSTFSPSGTDFGVDFNPVADRMRVVSNTGQNLRLNPSDGASTPDMQLQYAMGDPNFGQTPNVVGAAYTNNFVGATTTTLYDIDSSRDVLAMQNPPDNGTLNTVGALGFDLRSLAGFEVIDNGTAVATTSPGMTGSTFYTINLNTGMATFGGTIPVVLKDVTAESTGAAGPISGAVVRGMEDDLVEVRAKNDGPQAIEFVRFDSAPGYTITGVNIVGDPFANCQISPSGMAARCGPFSGPSYWAGNGQMLTIVTRFSPRYTDNGGVQMFVCAAPCMGHDAGPFAIGGPAPATVPPPGDQMPVRDRYDINGDGVVDFDDIGGFVDALVNNNGFTHDLNGPGLDGSDINKFIERLTAAPATGSSSSRRPKPILVARGRATLHGGETKRVRIPLTKAGKRFLRRYKRKRLRVTVGITVRHTPAGGTPETRSFKGKATFRVKRKRR